MCTGDASTASTESKESTSRCKSSAKAAAAAAPCAHGLTMLPFFSGERAPGWHTDATATITGIKKTTTGADVLRCGMEAVALRLGRVAQLLKGFIDPKAIIVASGTALTQSPVWRQIIADVTELPVYVNTAEEATTRGVAMLVAQGRPIDESNDAGAGQKAGRSGRRGRSGKSGKGGKGVQVSASAFEGSAVRLEDCIRPDKAAAKAYAKAGEEQERVYAALLGEGGAHGTHGDATATVDAVTGTGRWGGAGALLVGVGFGVVLGYVMGSRTR